MTLMMMIIFAAPISLQLLVICEAVENQKDNISKVIVVTYTVAVFAMTFWTSIFLVILY